MTSSLAITNHFEGTAITTLLYLGRPAWIARDIGAALGYAQRGKRLASKITGDWADEFIDGVDYQVLASSELNGLREQFVDVDDGGLKGTDSVPLENQRGLLVLFEPGLYLALVKTRKPIGKRLRRFLAERVLPQIMRDGRYLPERAVADGPALIDSKLLELRRLDLEDRQFKVSELRDTLANLDQLGHISPEVQAAMQVCAAEVALGSQLTALKPVVEDGWLSPSEIAARLGVTAQRVGLVVTALGLRGKDGLSRTIVNKARGHDRTVASYTYCPAAFDLIEAELRRQGHLKPKDA